MDLLEPYSVLPFPTDYYMLFKGIAFDGSFFYMTMPKSRRIYKFNKNFNQEGIIEAKKPYCCICYDNTEHCFWASMDKINTLIFKLDRNLKEIDFIRIENCSRLYSNMKGLSYNCEKDTLLAAFTNCIVEIKKSGDTICLPSCRKGIYSALSSIAPYYVLSLFLHDTQYIAIYTHDGRLIKSYCFSKIYQIQDILFYPCNKKEDKILTFYILAAKHCRYPRLLECKLDGNDLELCWCNYEFYTLACPEQKFKDQCAGDLLESIALEETALSHVINALGEKIQKSNQIADNVCDLLEVNKAVNKTLINITQLEHILYAKLDTISSMAPNVSCRNNNQDN